MSDTLKFAPNGPSQGQSFLGTMQSIWTLLVGIGLLMIGAGLLSSLLGVRAELEGFSVTVTGFTMAAYFFGFMVGAMWTVHAVRQVGHIRTYAALTSIASVTVLLHSLYIDAVVWGVMRFLSGICFAGIFVVTESWLNDRSDNSIRGQIMSIYMVISYIGLSLGQLAMNLAPPQQFDLFILISIVISIAVVPMLLNTGPAPDVPVIQPVNLKRLYRVSPTGVVTIITTGFVNGTIFSLAAVYAASVDFSIAEVSIFMLMILGGSACCQWPIGKLSDLYNRRNVLAITILIAALLCYISVHMQAQERWVFMLTVCAFGGIGMCLYPLGIAYTNDYLEQTELVGASSGLFIFFSVGSTIGPIVTGYVMDSIGPSGFFWPMMICLLLNGCFALMRIFVNPKYPVDENLGDFVAIPAQVTGNTISEVEGYYSDVVEANTDPKPD